MYNFNTPNRFLPQFFKEYYLDLKNEQYFNRTGKTLFEKLYSIIEDEKQNQEICLQIIKEILKTRKSFIHDIVKETSIDYVLKMKDIHYSTEILKLLVFHWDFKENQVDYLKYKDILAVRSPFCEIILDLKKGTGDSFKVLFDRYLARMKFLYKGYPNLHQITLQKDRKHLWYYMIFPNKYNTYENDYYIDREIPENSKLLDLLDDFIFRNLSPKQQEIQKQIMNTSEPKKFDKILEKLDYHEIEIILLARSQESYENILEQMLRKPINFVDHLLNTVCSTYGLETFYTKKMLLKVIIEL